MTAVQTLSHSRARGSKKGFTLTEIAIVLGIIGLILGAVWAAASSVYANLKANQAQQGILATAQAVRSMFATSANTGAAGANITTPGMFPTSWTSANAGCTAGTPCVGNPWHVNPTNSYAYVYGNGSQFDIEIDGMTDTGCAQLISFYSLAASSGKGGQIPGLVGSTIKTGAPTAGTAKIASSGFGTTQAGSALGSMANNPPVTGSFDVPSSCTGGTLNDNIAIAFDMSIM